MFYRNEMLSSDCMCMRERPYLPKYSVGPGEPSFPDPLMQKQEEDNAQGNPHSLFIHSFNQGGIYGMLWPVIEMGLNSHQNRFCQALRSSGAHDQPSGNQHITAAACLVRRGHSSCSGSGRRAGSCSCHRKLTSSKGLQWERSTGVF